MRLTQVKVHQDLYGKVNALSDICGLWHLRHNPAHTDVSLIAGSTKGKVLKASDVKTIAGIESRCIAGEIRVDVSDLTVETSPVFLSVCLYVV